MTDDLHTLAAKAMCDAFDAMPDDAHRPPPRVTATTVVPPPEPPCASCLAATDAVLAAVLPAHRRQVLAAMGEPREDARRWLAERRRVAYRTCSRLWLTTSHGHRPAGTGPCGDCIADAVLDAPGVEVQVQRTLIEQSGFRDHVVIRLPAQPIEGRDG